MWAQPWTKSSKKYHTAPTHRAIPTKEATQEGFFVKNKNKEKAKHTAPTPKAGSGATGTWKAPKKQPRAPVQPKASSTP